MSNYDKENAIRLHLEKAKWLDSIDDIHFLAQGEYNENWLVTSAGRRFVFRINHGSQLGLGRDQIAYEFEVLRAVEPSGLTPRPYFAAAEPEGLPGGVLLMEYLPGESLDYGRDLVKAARVFARVHGLPPSEKLIKQTEPVADIADESLGLIERFPEHPMSKVGEGLRRYYGHVMELYDKTRGLFAAEKPVMVNTEVNSGNFIVHGETAKLVDWEKAVVSSRYQDLGHFLVETTTRWKADVVLSEDEKRAFLHAYAEELRSLNANAEFSVDELREKTAVLEKTILLRALSWCYMAYYEYTQTDRPVQNTDTFKKIEEYLRESEKLLRF